VEFPDADHAGLFDLAQRLAHEGIITDADLTQIAAEWGKWLVKADGSQLRSDRSLEDWLKDTGRAKEDVGRWLQDIDKGARQRAEQASGPDGVLPIEPYIFRAGARSPDGSLESLAKRRQDRFDRVTAMRLVGRLGERKAGAPRKKRGINMTGIAGATGSKWRFPDFLDHARRFIGDVKNVATLKYTSQLRDYVAFARERFKTTLELFVRETTRCKRALRQAIGRGEISLNHIGGHITVSGIPGC
jgi:hypothetical protein